jgi:hypothetical protein
LLVGFGETVEEFSIQESALNTKNATTNSVASTRIKSFLGFGHQWFDAETVRDGVNLHEESESEQESEPYGGDHSTAIDHSVGSGRRRVGFLLGYSLSPSLGSANGKHTTPVRCTPRRNRLVRPNRISQASAVPRVSNSREA